METGGEVVDTKAASKSFGKVKVGLYVLLCCLGLYIEVNSALIRFSLWPVAISLILIFGLASAIFTAQTKLFFGGMFRNQRDVLISSPKFERRIRARYSAQISELTTLGFNYLFAVGQTFSTISLLMIFPAMVLFLMALKREVLGLQERREILIGYPIFASEDGTAFVHPSGLGVIFSTYFQDGMVLISTNYGNDNSSGSMFARRAHKGAGISETWHAHRRWIESLETESNPINRVVSFEAYARIAS